MTHDELCARALRWLRGTCRCAPAYSRNASCAEIPDAIGWTSAWKHRGSIVVECKTSRGDFYADQKKRFRWQKSGQNWIYPSSRISAKQALAEGFEKFTLSSMGDFRFYMCDSGILPLELIEKHAPDHGLIYRDGHAMRIIREASRRTGVDKDSEIRYLRFAIINGK